MRIISFVIGLLLVVTWANAQKKINTDSLQALLNPSIQDTAQVILLNQLANELARDHYDKSLSFSNKAFDLSEKLDYPRGKSRALRYMAKAYYFSNDHDKYIDYCKQSNVIALEHRFWDIVTENYESIASANMALWKNYPLALEYYLKSLEVYEKYYPQGKIYTPLMGIATVYKEQKQFDKALEYLNKSLPMSQAAHDNFAISICYENIGDLYFQIKQYDKSKENYNRALDLFTKVGSEGGQIFCYMGLANVYREQNNFSEALHCGKQVITLSGEFEKYERPRLYGNESLGKTFLAMRDFNQAREYFETALPIAMKLKMTESLRDIHGHLAKTYSELSNTKQAYDHQVLYAAYADTLVQSDKVRQLAEMQTRFETDNKEKEIEILKRDKALVQAYYSAAAGVVVVLLVIGLLVINRQRLKIRTERQLAEKENQILEERQTLMEAQLRNKELAAKQLNDQLEFKNKELATHTLNMIQKNEILENIKQGVTEIKNATPEELNHKLNGLLSMVNYSLHLDKEWENFKLHFEQVHQDFFKKLIEKFPELNANDLKLCALIKLNLDNREVATILNISQDSAKVARHRLRKKLNLLAEQNLIVFFNSIEG
jgi:tetratricopeptide (TPR) repeat protein